MLTKDKKHLKLFDDGIVINKTLPKWTNATKRAPVKKTAGYIDIGTANSSTQASYLTNQTTIIFQQDEFGGEREDPSATPDQVDSIDFSKASFDDAAKMGIKDLTAFINNYGVSRIFGQTYGSQLTSWDSGDVTISSGEKEAPKKKDGFFGRLKKKLFKEKKQVVTYEMDAMQFFENVKLLSKESMDTYKDRVAKYLNMLHSAKVTGQQALSEKLAREMFVNKYEAELYANNLYYVVTEEQMVEFANKTEKGVSLLYLSNFARMLPDEVIKKLEETNTLEVFDNYVILTYDPDGTKRGETEEERAKRKDPILFGLIAGSHKLYYICDWIDEKCDLTLQQFADTIEINKEELKMK